MVWSLVGLLVGQIPGAGIMSLHAVQGPRLGLPQMITSRMQFGVYGAVIPLLLVCMMYVGFSASGTVLAGQALAKLVHVSNATGMILFSALIIVIAVLGYRVIHQLGKLASLVGVLAFAYLFITLVITHDLTPVWQNQHFTLAHFLLAVSLSSSWQIAFCSLCLRLFALFACECLRENVVLVSVFRHRNGDAGVHDAGCDCRGAGRKGVCGQ